MSQIWKYNNIELEFDMGDVDTQERYEKAFTKMEETEKRLPKTGIYSELSRAYCGMFYQLYDELFGAGTGEKLMGKKANVRTTEECYNSFLTFVRTQLAEINRIRANTIGGCKNYGYNRKKGKRSS
ncbi:hypothetical protein IMSAGC018_01913 [Lachnospiraceae bacterium]|nr:hypothetical protein IMSAGC018_01913 [Lachnospiraceae bacterium]